MQGSDITEVGGGMNKYKTNKWMIIIFATILYIFSIVALTCYQPPKLYKKTGTVKKFSYQDKIWLDWILQSTDGDTMQLTFTDGSYYKVSGICYDGIDRRLFFELKKGEELTIIYTKRSGADRIYGITYQGKSYLDADAMVKKLAEEERKLDIAGWIGLGVTTAVALPLFLLNEKYKKRNDNFDKQRR